MSEPIIGHYDPVASGMTLSEHRVSQLLLAAHRELLNLPHEHPTEAREATEAVHKLQGLLAIRICRRTHPAGWPTYDTESEATS